jgi:putative SOS response-associated peptidase YedK
MCGRFAVTLPPDAMAQLFQAAPANDLPALPNYNICPTESVSVVMAEEGAGRRLVAMRWGFLPQWYETPGDGPLLINARAETIAEKPAFREACRARRCLIPASGFYEWTKDAEGNRLPWYITPRAGEVLALAGIWQDWQRGAERLRTCAIVTTGANAAMAKIHHRMPLVLAAEDWGKWLGEAGRGAARLMRPAPEEALAMHRVGTAVNANRASGPALIAPLPG